jgi:hypothetical protein
MYRLRCNGLEKRQKKKLCFCVAGHALSGFYYHAILKLIAENPNSYIACERQVWLADITCVDPFPLPSSVQPPLPPPPLLGMCMIWYLKQGEVTASNEADGQLWPLKPGANARGSQ